MSPSGLRAELVSVRTQSEALRARERQLEADLRRAEDDERERERRSEHERVRTLSTDTGATFEACASAITSSQGVRSYFVGAGMKGKLLAAWEVVEHRGDRKASRLRGCSNVPTSIELAVFRAFNLQTAR